MGIGLVITILLLGSMLGLCARQTTAVEDDNEVNSKDTSPVEVNVI